MSRKMFFASSLEYVLAFMFSPFGDFYPKWVYICRWNFGVIYLIVSLVYRWYSGELYIGINDLLLYQKCKKYGKKLYFKSYIFRHLCTNLRKNIYCAAKVKIY